MALVLEYLSTGLRSSGLLWAKAERFPPPHSSLLSTDVLALKTTLLPAPPTLPTLRAQRAGAALGSADEPRPNLLHLEAN